MAKKPKPKSVRPFNERGNLVEVNPKPTTKYPDRSAAIQGGVEGMRAYAKGRRAADSARKQQDLDKAAPDVAYYRKTGTKPLVQFPNKWLSGGKKK
jgi:hypothetical protein